MDVRRDGVVSKLLAPVPVPPMFRARQHFPRDRISPEEIPDAVAREMGREPFYSKLRPGMSVAVTAGSRGIANAAAITRAVVDEVKRRGARPFVVPAMGSHGGATAAGQRDVLAGYGITAEAMGCPIRSSMEVVSLGFSDTGVPVYMDKNAYESDGVILSCRIKPHNAFRGAYESGPCKMMAVGLGKQRGAEAVHAAGMDHIAGNILSVAKVILAKAPILFAIPCVENAYDETCRVEAIDAGDILDREPELLRYAFAHMPSLLVGEGVCSLWTRLGRTTPAPAWTPILPEHFPLPMPAAVCRSSGSASWTSARPAMEMP